MSWVFRMSPSSSLLTPAASCWARSHQGPSSSSFSGFSLDVASHGGLLCLPVSLSRTPLPFLHGLMTVCNHVCIDAMNFCLPHQTVSSRTGAESFSFIAVFVGTGAESGVKLPLRNGAARSGATRMLAVPLPIRVFWGNFFSSAVQLGQQWYQLIEIKCVEESRTRSGSSKSVCDARSLPAAKHRLRTEPCS